MKKGTKVFLKILFIVVLSLLFLALCLKVGFSLLAKVKLEDVVKLELGEKGISVEDVGFSILPPSVKLKKVSIENKKYHCVIFCEKVKVSSTFSQFLKFSESFKDNEGFKSFNVVANDFSLSPDIDYRKNLLILKAKKFEIDFKGNIINNRFTFDNQKVVVSANKLIFSYKSFLSNRVLEDVAVENFLLKNKFSKRKSLLKSDLFIDFCKNDFIKGEAFSKLAYPKVEFDFNVNYPVFFNTKGSGMILLSKKAFVNSYIHNAEVVLGDFNPFLKDYFYDTIFAYLTKFDCHNFYNCKELNIGLNGNILSPKIKYIK